MCVPGFPAAQPADDPTGLRYDRADLDDTPTVLRAAEGWSITGRGPNATHIGAGPAGAEQPGRTPVVVLPPIRPRDLAGLTVAQVERIKRGVPMSQIDSRTKES